MSDDELEFYSASELGTPFFSLNESASQVDTLWDHIASLFTNDLYLNCCHINAQSISSHHTEL